MNKKQPATKKVTKVKKPKDPNKRYTNAKYTKNELLSFLDKAIELYPDSPDISFHSVIATQCTMYAHSWDHYLSCGENPDDDIIAKFNVLRSQQIDKTVNGAMTGKYNPAFSMFLLKTKHSYLEEQHKRKLELEEKKVDTMTQVTDLVGQAMNINFTIAEHRTEDQINNLLGTDNHE